MVRLRVGIVGGNGWLGSAIANALLTSGISLPEDLTLSCRTTPPEGRVGVWTADNQSLADRSDLIILSVRPEDWPQVSLNAGGKLVISVMAGITLGRLAERHRTDRVVRALPNAAAEVGKSYTPWVGSAAIAAEDREAVAKIFSCCGLADEVARERDIDYLTGLSGSGPAFPALLAAAMQKHAVESGIAPDIARRAVNAVLIGAGRLLEKDERAPGDTVDVFLAYRGTTAAAISAMRAEDFDAAVAEGLAAAFARSLQMGNAS